MKKHPKNRPLTQKESESMHREALDATVSNKIITPTSADNRGVMGLEDSFSFGKYARKDIERTVEYIIDHDMGYIDWLTENDVVSFDEETYEYIEHMKQT